ncbi:MAG: hypothetical protein MK364_17640, partial [Pirellulales bacterium]|nr:hypothetical protein [Pirellulales bacterium]
PGSIARSLVIDGFQFGRHLQVRVRQRSARGVDWYCLFCGRSSLIQSIGGLSVRRIGDSCFVWPASGSGWLARTEEGGLQGTSGVSGRSELQFSGAWFRHNFWMRLHDLNPISPRRDNGRGTDHATWEYARVFLGSFDLGT